MTIAGDARPPSALAGPWPPTDTLTPETPTAPPPSEPRPTLTPAGGEPPRPRRRLLLIATAAAAVIVAGGVATAILTSSSDTKTNAPPAASVSAPPPQSTAPTPAATPTAEQAADQAALTTVRSYYVISDAIDAHASDPMLVDQMQTAMAGHVLQGMLDYRNTLISKGIYALNSASEVQVARVIANDLQAPGVASVTVRTCVHGNGVAYNRDGTQIQLPANFTKYQVDTLTVTNARYPDQTMWRVSDLPQTSSFVTSCTAQ